MAVPSVDVPVSGHAAGLTASQSIAEPWKESVAHAVGSAWTWGHLEEECAIRLTFNLEPSRYNTTAVFNLLKSTIDGLSYPIFAQSPGGSKWNTEDWWITELHAHKRCTHQAPSVKIKIGPTESSFPPIVENVVADVFVPGSPPPWPGDSVGTQKVEAWRAALANVLPAIQPVNPLASLGVGLQFAVEPGKMKTTDIDNYCVPAAASTCYVLFGDLKHPQSIVDLHATKVCADAGHRLGVRVQVWEVQGA